MNTVHSLKELNPMKTAEIEVPLFWKYSNYFNIFDSI